MTIRTSYLTEKEYLWHHRSKHRTDFGHSHLTGETLVFVFDWMKYGLWVQGLHSKQIDIFHTWVGDHCITPQEIKRFKAGLEAHVHASAMGFEDVYMKQAYPVQFDFFVHIIRAVIESVGRHWQELVVESGKINPNWYGSKKL
jgi:hypothetical protein